MAEIKSLMMDSLSKVQSNNQVQMKKDKNANDFANCLSASKMVTLLILRTVCLTIRKAVILRLQNQIL